MPRTTTKQSPSPQGIASAFASALRAKLQNLDDILEDSERCARFDELVKAVQRREHPRSVMTLRQRVAIENRLQGALPENLKHLVAKLSDASTTEMMDNRSAAFELGLELGRGLSGGAR